MLNAMRNVVVQDFLLDPAQGRAHRGNLCHDVDTVAIFIDHAGEAAHLAFDAVETLEDGGFGLFLHACQIYPMGVYLARESIPLGGILYGDGRWLEITLTTIAADIPVMGISTTTTIIATTRPRRRVRRAAAPTTPRPRARYKP